MHLSLIIYSLRDKNTLNMVLGQIRLEPFQERLLELIALSRQQGHHRNLLVSATGTGKTVMAAVDYGRLSKTLQRSRLLFVAHREEILTQTIGTFRHGLRDPAFGELWVGGARPNRFDHVFASIRHPGESRGLARTPRLRPRRALSLGTLRTTGARRTASKPWSAQVALGNGRSR